jgi:nitrite reductase/ring-hydroxylating ferredoxin subunit
VATDPHRVVLGTLADLQDRGCLTGKAGSQPVCVFWHEGRPFALDDRCPHMGFPLHRGTVENGLVTCHWHHARFDLASGGTLNPFADDVRTYPVELDGDRVTIVVEPERPDPDHLRARLVEGLEQGLTLVSAKAVLGLLEAGVPAPEVVRVGVAFGTTYRAAGWGSGLTVLVAMANVLPHLDAADRPLALTHGMAFVSRDTRGRPPRFPLTPLGNGAAGRVAPERLSAWYRRFIETRAADPAERSLLTAIAAGRPLTEIEGTMTAAATDHVFLDGGHTIDFTNKAFEALGVLGPDQAGTVLPTLVAQTAAASRSEESGRWRHPFDLLGLIDDATRRLPALLADGAAGRAAGAWDGVTWLAADVLGDDPASVCRALCDAVATGATFEQLGRAVAYAAALRLTRFHTQNDHGDWDVVHHAFTSANAVHQSLVRAPTPELLRGVFHNAMKVFLDRFLNVPAARHPERVATDLGVTGDLAALQRCWDEQGRVDEAGATAWRHLAEGGDPARLVAALGAALLAEDAQFHWFQTYEAAVRQAAAWPAGSEEAALILVGCARFLAAHSPTRRELAKVVATATRLRRGDALYEDE